jgi:hypothetical protein
MSDITEPLPRRQVWRMLALLAGSLAVAAELQLPGRKKKAPDLPNCEPLPNPWDSAFSDDFGAGVGLQCSSPRVPASPRVVIRDGSPSVTITPGI